MESDPGHRMNITWVIADDVLLDPDFDIQQLKNIGSTWGSWRTWRTFGTDNVICHNTVKAQELIQRAFHAGCNFYISNSTYMTLDRPTGVRLYEGEFVHDTPNHEEIVALHLTAGISDIVLLLGFDLSEAKPLPDRLEQHRVTNYRNLIRQAMKDNAQTQWVLVDHDRPVGKGGDARLSREDFRGPHRRLGRLGKEVRGVQGRLHQRLHLRQAAPDQHEHATHP
jgi:hypothetical protein